jgi:hypothetical protein
MNTPNERNRLLSRISSAITANAADLQRLDLAQLGRKADKAYRFENLLTSLKAQLADKAALRVQVPVAEVAAELESLAA